MGAFIDVWVDNLARGSLWVLALPHALGLIPVLLETTTFMAISQVTAAMARLHRHGIQEMPSYAFPFPYAMLREQGGSKAWKEGGVFSGAPHAIGWVMCNNFRTPQGAFIVSAALGNVLLGAAGCTGRRTGWKCRTFARASSQRMHLPCHTCALLQVFGLMGAPLLLWASQ